jgi:hypothetical protein
VKMFRAICLPLLAIDGKGGLYGLDEWGSVPGRHKDFSPHPQCVHAASLACEADHLSPYNAKLKKGWRSTSIAHTSWRGS